MNKKSNIGYTSDDYESTEDLYYDGDIEDIDYYGSEGSEETENNELWEEQKEESEVSDDADLDPVDIIEDENVDEDENFGELLKEFGQKKYSDLDEEDEKKEDQLLVNLIRNGSAEEKSYALQAMLDKTEKFIHDILHKRYYTYHAHYDELYHECIEAVLQNAGDYDPDQGTKTTFFLRYILHACTVYITNNIHKTTPHYANKYRIIRPVIEKYTSLGIKFTTRDIALETGIPLDTIIKTIKDNSKTFNYIDNQSLIDNQVYDYKPASLPKSPEEEYIKKEESDVLYRALLQFDQETFEIFAYANGLDGNESYNIPPYIQMDKKDIAKKFHKSSSQITQIINFVNTQLYENDELYNMFKTTMNHDKKMFSKRNSSFIPIEAGNIMSEDANSVYIEVEVDDNDTSNMG